MLGNSTAVLHRHGHLIGGAMLVSAARTSCKQAVSMFTASCPRNCAAVISAGAQHHCPALHRAPARVQRCGRGARVRDAMAG